MSASEPIIDLFPKVDQLILSYGYSNTGLKNIYGTALQTLCVLGSEERFENSHVMRKVMNSNLVLDLLTARSGEKANSVMRITKARKI